VLAPAVRRTADLLGRVVGREMTGSDVDRRMGQLLANAVALTAPNPVRQYVRELPRGIVGSDAARLRCLLKRIVSAAHTDALMQQQEREESVEGEEEEEEEAEEEEEKEEASDSAESRQEGEWRCAICAESGEDSSGDLQKMAAWAAAHIPALG